MWRVRDGGELGQSRNPFPYGRIGICASDIGARRCLVGWTGLEAVSPCAQCSHVHWVLVPALSFTVNLREHPPTPQLDIFLYCRRPCHVPDNIHSRSFLALPSYIPDCLEILPKADQERPYRTSACLPAPILQFYYCHHYSSTRSSSRIWQIS